jgi:hypothetical protein
MTRLKRATTGVAHNAHPVVKGPFRVPVKRASENKVVSIPASGTGAITLKVDRSKSAPKAKVTLKKALLEDYGEDIH